MSNNFQSYITALRTLETLKDKIGSTEFEKKKQMVQTKFDIKECPTHGPFEFGVSYGVCPECRYTTRVQTGLESMELFGFDMMQVRNRKLLTSKEVKDIISSKNPTLANQVENCLVKLKDSKDSKAPKYSSMDLTFQKAEDVSPHANVYECLALLLHKESLQIVQQKLINYLKNSQEIEILTFLAVARFFRASKSFREAILLYLMIIRDETFDSVKDWLTPDEILFVSAFHNKKDPSDNLVEAKFNKISPNQSKWMKLSKTIGTPSPSMDQLMEMTGMERAKEIAYDLYCQLVGNEKITIKESKVKERVNCLFFGNPGCGKTVTARLYGKILSEIGARNDLFIETRGVDVLMKGNKDFEKTLDSVKGGVLFIDEAYDIKPSKNTEGALIIGALMKFMDENIYDTTVILAGYKDDIQIEILDFNPGLKSRFTKIIEFQDFECEQLESIFNNMVKSSKWMMETRKISGIVSRRLDVQRDQKGFGNGRDVENIFKSLQNKAVSRQTEQNKKQVERVILLKDLMGESPDRKLNFKLDKVLDEIDSLSGFEGPKKLFASLVEQTRTNYNLEMKGEKPDLFILNAIFTGNPGTGKTFCAGIYGKLLKSLNYLSDGGFVTKKATDFIGNVVGDSATKTKTIIEEAKGKILLIDEAYAICETNYAPEIGNAIVDCIQGSAGQDLCVILCGYEDKIAKLLQLNEGLPRRFPLKFHFDDFTDEQLMNVLSSKVNEKNLVIPKDVKQKVVKYIAKKRGLFGFGNAGDVAVFLEKAILNAKGRRSLVEADFEIPKPLDPASFLKSFRDIDDILQAIKKIQNRVDMAYEENRPQDITELQESLYFLFTGPPGVGKTSIAQCLADILSNLGLLPTNMMIEKKPGDIVGNHVGDAQENMNKAFKDAKGGVLFIDEAYQFVQDDFGLKALETLVGLTTDKNYGNGKTVVILSGYEQDINFLLKVNRGLKSRFKRMWKFKAPSVEVCFEILSSFIKEREFGFEEVDESKRYFIMKMKPFIDDPKNDWGNVRDVKNILSNIIEERVDRVTIIRDRTRRIILQDFQKGVDLFLRDRTLKDDQSMIRFMSKIPTKQRKQTETSTEMKMDMKEQLKDVDLAKKQNDDELVRKRDTLTIVLESLEMALKDLYYNTEEKVLSALKSTKLPQDILDYVTKGTKMDSSAVNQILSVEKINLIERFQTSLAIRKKEEERLRRLEEEKKAEEERQRKHAKEMQRLTEEERKKQEAAEQERVREFQAKQEQEKNEIQKQQKIQERLRTLMRCERDFLFNKVPGGYRCAGGSHFVSDSQINFM